MSNTLMEFVKEITRVINEKLKSYYTSEELDSRFENKVTQGTVYNKTETYNRTELDNFLDTKANENMVYNKNETYNISEIDELLLTKNIDVIRLSTPETNYAATYVIKQNNVQVGSSINIPKDFLVRSASVKTCTVKNNPEQGYNVGDIYLDWVINAKDNSESDSHLYVNLSSLIDVYVGDNVSIIVEGNVFSVKTGGISRVHLSEDILTSLGYADDYNEDKWRLFDVYNRFNIYGLKYLGEVPEALLANVEGNTDEEKLSNYFSEANLVEFWGKFEDYFIASYHGVFYIVHGGFNIDRTVLKRVTLIKLSDNSFTEEYKNKLDLLNPSTIVNYDDLYSILEGYTEDTFTVSSNNDIIGLFSVTDSDGALSQQKSISILLHLSPYDSIEEAVQHGYYLKNQAHGFSGVKLVKVDFTRFSNEGVYEYVVFTDGTLDNCKVYNTANLNNTNEGVDLSDYLTESEINTLLNNKAPVNHTHGRISKDGKALMDDGAIYSDESTMHGILTVDGETGEITPVSATTEMVYNTVALPNIGCSVYSSQKQINKTIDLGFEDLQLRVNSLESQPSLNPHDFKNIHDQLTMYNGNVNANCNKELLVQSQCMESIYEYCTESAYHITFMFDFLTSLESILISNNNNSLFSISNLSVDTQNMLYYDTGYVCSTENYFRNHINFIISDGTVKLNILNQDDALNEYLTWATQVMETIDLPRPTPMRLFGEYVHLVIPLTAPLSEQINTE